MATITIDIPNGADVTRALDAFAAVFGYQPLIGGSPNPETKAAFAKRQVAIWAKSIVAKYESERDAAAAQQAAIVSANQLNIT